MQRRITTGVACIAVRTKRASPCTWHMATLWSTLRQYWTPKHDFNLINCYWTICVMTRIERLCIVWKEKCRHAYLWIPTLPGRTEIESECTCEWYTSHCSTWCQTYTVDVGRYLANRTEILIQTALNWIKLRLKKKKHWTKSWIQLCRGSSSIIQ